MLNMFAAVNWAKYALNINVLSTFHKMYRSPLPDYLMHIYKTITIKKKLKKKVMVHIAQITIYSRKHLLVSYHEISPIKLTSKCLYNILSRIFFYSIKLKHL